MGCCAAQHALGACQQVASHASISSKQASWLGFHQPCPLPAPPAPTLSLVSLIWLCALIWLMSVSFSCTFIIAFQKDLLSLVCGGRRRWRQAGGVQAGRHVSHGMYACMHDRRRPPAAAAPCDRARAVPPPPGAAPGRVPGLRCTPAALHEPLGLSGVALGVQVLGTPGDVVGVAEGIDLHGRACRAGAARGGME